MKSRATTILLAPTFIFLLVFMGAPILLAVGISFLTADPYGGATAPVSFEAYIQFLFERDFDDSLIFTSDYLWVFARSFGIALFTTVISIAIGLPVAWYIVCQRPSRRQLLISLLTLPLFTNLLIRTYCWILILRDQGLINNGLANLGLINSPLPLLYNNFAVLVGLVYSFLPFMVLPIYAALEKMDPRLIEASFDLYATRWKTFRSVIWPTAKPGVAAGSLLVFAPALGSFIGPDLLGGGRVLLIGGLIQNQFSSARNWPFGSAVAVLLTVVTFTAIAWSARRSRSLEVTR